MKLKKWLNMLGDGFDRVVTVLADSGLYVATVLALVLTLTVFVEAVLRYGRLSKVSFAEELSGYMLAAIMFLSLAAVLRKGKHLRLRFLVDHLSPKIQNILTQIQPIVLVLWLTVIFVPVWNLLKLSWEIHAVSITPLQTPQWIPQLMVVIGIVLFWLQALAQVIQNIRGVRQ